MNTTTVHVSEAAIRELAESKIMQTCQANGIQRSDLKAIVIEDAYKFAQEKLMAEAQRANDPHWQELQKVREELRVAQMQNEALRIGRGVGNSEAPSNQLTVDQVQRKLGPMVWNHSLDSDGRLRAIGINPETITASVRLEIVELFGPKSHSTRAQELYRVNKSRYLMLREAGRALRII